MGKDDVGKALEAMTSDMDVAERLAAGDFTDLPEAELTDAERAMVVAAADDIPDVSGFAIFVKIGGVAGESDQRVEIEQTANFDAAVRYSGFAINFTKFDR